MLDEAESKGIASTFNGLGESLLIASGSCCEIAAENAIAWCATDFAIEDRFGRAIPMKILCNSPRALRRAPLTIERAPDHDVRWVAAIFAAGLSNENFPSSKINKPAF